jgi:hypothetical protein
MTELVCNYAILRFLPYKDIGEFINVGVLVHCPEINLFDFRVAPSRNRRVRIFFPELDPKVYSAVMSVIKRELNRFRNIDGLFVGGQCANEMEIGQGLACFRSLLQRREALLSFAAPGTLLANPTMAAEELYNRYVKRQFAKEHGYQERVMQIQLARWMGQWGVRQKYNKDVQVGDAMFHLTIPFVHLKDENPMKGIKPLDLDKQEPTKVFEHGDMWVQRMRRLAGRENTPERMIFAVKLPTGDGARAAADQILADLMSLPRVEYVHFEQTDELRQKIAV